jgi:hypothetical protein
MALKRLDKIGIVVDDLELTIPIFQELGLQLEGRAIRRAFISINPGWALSSNMETSGLLNPYQA